MMKSAEMMIHGKLRLFLGIGFVYLGVLVCAAHGLTLTNLTSKLRNELVCEEQEMTIRCPEDHLISIVRAVYGRFTQQFCNDLGDYFPNTDCDYAGTKRVMMRRCNGHKACRVRADDLTFKDNCPETYKYLEVVYQCIAAEIVVEGRSRCEDRNACTINVSSTEIGNDPCPYMSKYLEVHYYCTKVTSTTTLATTTTTTTSEEVLAIGRQRLDEIPADAANGNQLSTVASVRADSGIVENREAKSELPAEPQFCPRRVIREIDWPVTRVNSMSTRPCPNNAKASAQLLCAKGGEWIRSTLDLSLCVSSAVDALNATLTAPDPKSEQTLTPGLLTETAVALANHLRSSDHVIYGGDVAGAVQMLGRIVSLVKERLPGLSIERRLSAVEELGRALVRTSGQLLNGRHEEAWQDLPQASVRVATAAALMAAVERSGRLIAQQMLVGGQNLVSEAPNISLEVSLVQLLPEKMFRFPGKHFYAPDVDFIQLPEAALRHGAKNAVASVVFVEYENLGSYLEPSGRLVFRGNEEFLVDRRVVSKIISASVNLLPKVENLATPVIITFATPKLPNHSNPQCVFWDSSAANFENPDEYGDWSGEGCHLVQHSDTHTVCACNHLTNFAVLMDFNGIDLAAVHEIALITITYAGCVVSIICLLAAIVAFQCFCTQTDRTTIHKNLCFCLLVSELLFLFGIGQVKYKIACSIIAGFLHYFFLASFAWMLLEGIQLYFMLVQVFNDCGRKKYFYLFGYGMPLIIVGIALGVDYESYGTGYHCWLNTENYFMFSFIGPVIVVLVANFLFLIMAVVVMCRYTSVGLTSFKHNGRSGSCIDISFGFRVKGAVLQVFLLGLTWSFGLLYISDNTIVFAYLFTILNSLQGLFIFIFHVMLNDKIKRKWERWLQQSDWLPSCIRGVKPLGSSSGNNYSIRKPGSSSTSSGGLENRMLQKSSTAYETDASSKSCFERLFQPQWRSSKRSSGQLLLDASSHMFNPEKLGKAKLDCVICPGMIADTTSPYFNRLGLSFAVAAASPSQKYSNTSTATQASSVIVSEDPDSGHRSIVVDECGGFLLYRGDYAASGHPQPPSFKPPPIPEILLFDHADNGGHRCCRTTLDSDYLSDAASNCCRNSQQQGQGSPHSATTMATAEAYDCYNAAPRNEHHNLLFGHACCRHSWSNQQQQPQFSGYCGAAGQNQFLTAVNSAGLMDSCGYLIPDKDSPPAALSVAPPSTNRFSHQLSVPPTDRLGSISPHSLPSTASRCGQDAAGACCSEDCCASHYAEPMNGCTSMPNLKHRCLRTLGASAADDTRCSTDCKSGNNDNGSSFHGGAIMANGLLSPEATEDASKSMDLIQSFSGGIPRFSLQQQQNYAGGIVPLYASQNSVSVSYGENQRGILVGVRPAFFAKKAKPAPPPRHI